MSYVSGKYFLMTHHVSVEYVTVICIKYVYVYISSFICVIDLRNLRLKGNPTLSVESVSLLMRLKYYLNLIELEKLTRFFMFFNAAQLTEVS